MNNDASREAFEKWCRTDDEDLEDGSPSPHDYDAHHKYWLYAAWQASRKQALEEAAKACDDLSNGVLHYADYYCAKVIRSMK